MKHSWLLRLTPAQFDKLYKGLRGRFRFYLNLAFETVTYDPKSDCLTIHIPFGNNDLAEQISTYITGFAQAIY